MAPRGCLCPLVQAVAYLPDESLGAGRPCPCAIATVRRYFDTTDDGGVYLAYTHAGSLRWVHRPTALPSTSDCPTSRDAWGISVDPDTHDVDVATSCGLAVGRPDGSFTTTTVPGAPSQSWRSVQALGGGKLLLAGTACGTTTDATGVARRRRRRGARLRCVCVQRRSTRGRASLLRRRRNAPVADSGLGSDLESHPDTGAR